jgi:hypothetical protein
MEFCDEPLVSAATGNFIIRCIIISFLGRASHILDILKIRNIQGSTHIEEMRNT